MVAMLAVTAVLGGGTSYLSGTAATAYTYGAVQNVSDALSRRVANGLGIAPQGGPYSVSAPTRLFRVTPGDGSIGPIAPGRSLRTTLSRVVETNQRMQFTLSLRSLPVGGGGEYLGIELRRQTTGDTYRAKLRVWPNGLMTLGFSRVRHGTETPLKPGASARGRLSAGSRFVLSAQVMGTSPVTLQVSAWLAGRTSPAWQDTVTDNSDSRITQRGAAGLWGYTSSTTKPVTVDVRDVRGWRLVPAVQGSSAASRSVASATSNAPTSSSPTSSNPAGGTTVKPSSSSVPASSSATSPPPSSSNNAAPGAVNVGQTSYPIPEGAVFVSPQGSDSAEGSLAHPYATVARAISAARSGGTIVLRAGTYHENVTIPADKTLTIQNYPGEAAWFDGSSSVTSWTKVGGAWVHKGWTAKFDSTAGYSATIASNTNPGWVWVNPNYPMAAHPDQVWIDDTALKQVSSLSEVTAGTFYVDYGSDELYVGSDPSARAVRASDIDMAITVNSPSSVLRGFGVRRYATPIPEMGTVKLMGAGDQVDNLVISDNASQGLYIRSTGITVDHVTTERNGLLGMQANYADGLRVLNALSDNNNVEHFNDSPVSGGIKITRTRGIMVKDSEVSGNQGNGLWFDESCYNFVVTGGQFARNTHYGVVAELSALGVVADNRVSENGYDGVRITDTSEVKIWNNTFGGNYRAVELAQDSRQNVPSTPGHDPRQPDPDPTISWVTSDIQIEDNLFVNLGQFHVYVYDSSHQRSADQMNLTVDGNVFTLPGSGQAEIGWDAGGGNIVTYKSSAAFTAGTGQGAHNVDASSGTSSEASESQPLGDPLPLPADVAAATAQPTGTRHVGTF